MEANRVVPIETLIDRVWGDDPPDTVRNVVYGYVGRLKTALHQADQGATGVQLDRSSGGYTLRTPTGRVDLYRFRDLVDQARAQEKQARAQEKGAGTAAATDDQVAELLERALRIWCGEPLT